MAAFSYHRLRSPHSCLQLHISWSSRLASWYECRLVVPVTHQHIPWLRPIQVPLNQIPSATWFAMKLLLQLSNRLSIQFPQHCIRVLSIHLKVLLWRRCTSSIELTQTGLRENLLCRALWLSSNLGVRYPDCEVFHRAWNEWVGLGIPLSMSSLMWRWLAQSFLTSSVVSNSVFYFLEMASLRTTFLHGLIDTSLRQEKLLR